MVLRLLAQKNPFFITRPILLLSDSYYKYGTLSCLGLDFSDRTVRLIGIFLQNCEQYL